MREIDVDNFLDPLGTGTSKPVLVVGDDFNEYVLKNQRTIRDGKDVACNSMFVNELLSYQIGTYLGVPMPEAVIAFVDERLIKDDPRIRFAYRFEKGKFFGSEKLEYVENNLEENYLELVKLRKPYRKKSWKKFFEDISNKDDISKIVAFDVFIGNLDRYRNEGNILINREHPRKMYAIDHGHAFFGPMWDIEKIKTLKMIDKPKEYIYWYCGLIFSCMPGVIFSALQEYIDLTDIKNNPFNEVIKNIEAIDIDMIELWMNNIPNEWYVNKEVQMAQYADFLLKHKQLVKIVIQAMADHEFFINYKGGALQWDNQKAKSHTAY